MRILLMMVFIVIVPFRLLLRRNNGYSDIGRFSEIYRRQDDDIDAGGGVLRGPFQVQFQLAVGAVASLTVITFISEQEFASVTVTL